MSKIIKLNLFFSYERLEMFGDENLAASP